MNDLYGTEPWPLPELKIPSLAAWKAGRRIVVMAHSCHKSMSFFNEFFIFFQCLLCLNSFDFWGFLWFFVLGDDFSIFCRVNVDTQMLQQQTSGVWKLLHSQLAQLGTGCMRISSGKLKNFTLWKVENFHGMLRALPCFAISWEPGEPGQPGREDGDHGSPSGAWWEAIDAAAIFGPMDLAGSDSWWVAQRFMGRAAARRSFFCWLVCLTMFKVCVLSVWEFPIWMIEVLSRLFHDVLCDLYSQFSSWCFFCVGWNQVVSSSSSIARASQIPN